MSEKEFPFQQHVPELDVSFAEKDSAEPKSPGFILHPVRGFVWAAFWGTPLAAGIVMAINFSRLGRKSAARLVFLGGLLATVLLFGIILAIPEEAVEDVPNAVFYVPQLLIVAAIGGILQSELIQKHSDAGGKVASAWPSVGIGMLCLPVVLAGLFAAVLFLSPPLGTLIKFGNDEIYIVGDATEQDAQKTAAILRQEGLFGSGGASVRLEAESGRYTISFVLVRDSWNNPDSINAIKAIGQSLVIDALPRPLKLQMCNEYFEIRKTLSVE